MNHLSLLPQTSQAETAVLAPDSAKSALLLKAHLKARYEAMNNVDGKVPDSVK